MSRKLESKPAPIAPTTLLPRQQESQNEWKTGKSTEKRTDFSLFSAFIT
jgi:hypothetical protein